MGKNYNVSEEQPKQSSHAEQRAGHQGASTAVCQLVDRGGGRLGGKLGLPAIPG